MSSFRCCNRSSEWCWQKSDEHRNDRFYLHLRICNQQNRPLLGLVLAKDEDAQQLWSQTFRYSGWILRFVNCALLGHQNWTLETEGRRSSPWYRTQSVCGTCAGGRMIMFQLTGQVTPLAKAVLRKAVKLKPRDIIGSGGYGTVYKLVLDDMSTFAVKKITSAGMDRDTGFERELQTLADVRHRNVCTLRGYYSAPQINLLVYDLMPNGNLNSALHCKNSSTTWTPFMTLWLNMCIISETCDSWPTNSC